LYRRAELRWPGMNVVTPFSVTTDVLIKASTGHPLSYQWICCYWKPEPHHTGIYWLQVTSYLPSFSGGKGAGWQLASAKLIFHAHEILATWLQRNSIDCRVYFDEDMQPTAFSFNEFSRWFFDLPGHFIDSYYQLSLDDSMPDKQVWLKRHAATADVNPDEVLPFLPPGHEEKQVIVHIKETMCDCMVRGFNAIYDWRKHTVTLGSLEFPSLENYAAYHGNMCYFHSKDAGSVDLIHFLMPDGTFKHWRSFKQCLPAIPYRARD